MDVGEVGFAAVAFKPSIFDDGWSNEATNIGKHSATRLCPDKTDSDTFTILPLPIPSEDQDPSFSLATTAFTPTWAPDMPTEIIAVFMAEYREGLPLLISYHLQMSKSGPTHELELMKWNHSPSRCIPWNNNGLTNSARMYELGETLCCFNVLSSSPWPCLCVPDGFFVTECPAHKDEDRDKGAMIELALRPDALPPFTAHEIMRFSVEPWSGDLTVLSSQTLYVVSFDRRNASF